MKNLILTFGILLLMMTGMVIMMLSRGSASIGRINEVLDTQIDIKNISNIYNLKKSPTLISHS